MRFGLSLPNNHGTAHVRDLVSIAQDAEALGFDSVWVSEHLFHSSYVAARLGDAPYHEALTVLTAVAAQTDRVRLGTSVLVLPWHHPARLAKAIASIDDLSAGRVLLGVGVAQTEDEFANLGVDFHRRGAIANDTLAAIRALWSQSVPHYSGSDYQFDGLQFEPKPRQQPGPPILIGGNSPAAFKRLANYGDGWHALSVSPAEYAAGKHTIETLFAKAGRSASDLHYSVRTMASFSDQSWDRPIAERRTLRGTPDELRTMVGAYQDAGVAEIIVDANSGNRAEVDDLMRRFADEVMPGV